MKANLFLLLAAAIGIFDSVSAQSVSQQDLVTTCRVLVALCDEAGHRNPQAFDEVVIYANAYNAVKTNVTDRSLIKDFDNYFQKLIELNSGKPQLVMSLQESPKSFGQGWRHDDINQLLGLIGKGLKPDRLTFMESVIHFEQFQQSLQRLQKQMQETTISPSKR